MSASPHELSPEKSLLDCIKGHFKRAYELQMAGQSPIGVCSGLSGPVEIIALNPISIRDFNDRYVLCGPSLSFSGLTWNTGDGEMDVAYLILKIPLADGDERAIAEVDKDDLIFSSTMIIGEAAEVYDLSTWLSPEEVTSLSSSIEACEVSTSLPAWAEASID